MAQINIANFPEGVSAHLARTKLASEGIEGVVVRISRYRAMSGAGYELRVEDALVERAREILGLDQEMDLDEYIDADDPAYRHCPQCRSANVYRDPFTGLQRVVLVTTFGLGYLALIKSLHCRKCGFAWRER